MSIHESVRTYDLGFAEGWKLSIQLYVLVSLFCVEKLKEIMLAINLNILKHSTEIEFEDWEIIAESLSFV